MSEVVAFRASPEVGRSSHSCGYSVIIVLYDRINIVGALDFSEIPAANAGPKRDDWELFAREFLEWKGFHVVAGPDRGVDGGRDLIVEEIRRGPGGETRLRWLVSCKHLAP